jgi:hypothetical protein
MGKTTTEGTDTQKIGVFISLDPISDDRLTRQAARKYGTVQGYKQNYARGAIMERVEKDEATMPVPKVEGDSD